MSRKIRSHRYQQKKKLQIRWLRKLYALRPKNVKKLSIEAFGKVGGA